MPTLAEQRVNVPAARLLPANGTARPGLVKDRLPQMAQNGLTSWIPGWSPNRLAPDLTRLPIVHNLRGFSLVEGVRAAVSVSVMIALSEYFGLQLLREAALAALWTCLCDPGGPIRRRVPVLLSFALIGALLTGGFGLLRGLGPAIALPVGVLALFAASFARVYGQAVQQLGALLSFTIVLSLDTAMSFADAAATAGAFAFGALWATVLSLLIWRLYPYRATAQAVAEVYHALAALTGDLYMLVQSNEFGDVAWQTHARSRRSAVRQAIETARDTVLDMLRSRGAASLPASRSLIRLETADQIFAALIALSDVLERGTAAERAAAKRLLRRLRPLLAVLSGPTPAELERKHPRIRRSIDAMESEVIRLPATDVLRVIGYRLVDRLRIANNQVVPDHFMPDANVGERRLALRERLLRPLRTNLNWRSPTLRHALRAAVMAGPALAFTMFWFSPYDHWLTITIVATMQPFFALTYARALERIVGTALGGIVAAGVGLLCTTPLSIALAMFPLAMVAMAVRAVNFGLYMLALTPVVVLLVETGQPDAAEWRIALVRASLTIIGGVLAVAASFALWPSREPERLMAGAQEAIAAHGRYAGAVLGWLLDDVPEAAIDPARRDAGLATNTLEASISRALIEQGGGGRDLLEAVLVIDAALRRCAGGLTAMLLDPGIRVAMPAGSVRVWRDWFGAAMQALASGKTALPARPETEAAGSLGRLMRQIELMGEAMQRLAG
jgi:hypothetical protein